MTSEPTIRPATDAHRGTCEPAGTVITFANTPDIFKFHFVVNAGFTALKHVKVGRYVAVKETNGIIVGQIANLFKVNEYFLNASTLKDPRSTPIPIASIFPVDQWEYVIGDVDVMGFYPHDTGNSRQGVIPTRGHHQCIEKSAVPPSPGAPVEFLDTDLLEAFLGLDAARGLDLGTVDVEAVHARLNMTRLFQKHLAVLAMSGAGKSYLVSVILEELIKREGDIPPVILIDTHGEYAATFKASRLKERFPKMSVDVEIIDGTFVQLATPFLGARSFYNYMPNMSPVQGRELNRIFDTLKRDKKTFDLRDLMNAIEADDKLAKKSKEALAGWLFQLDILGIFTTSEFPRVHDVLKPNRLVIIDLSNLSSQVQKQIIVDYIASRAFYLRKSKSVPPFCLMIEEAHQYVPQADASHVIARKTIETIAREGRKFFASLCLVSQRPVHLNTTILSQCNTQIIMKVSNPYDLDHIRQSSEKITAGAMKMISGLPVGHALVVGGAVNMPIFFKVRSREFLVEPGEPSIDDELRAYKDSA